MALFYDGQRCPLCGENMTNADQLFSTSHFLGPDSDLCEYSDAVMHWDCYAKWEHQARFGQMYFDANRHWGGQDEPWGVAHSDDQVMVKTNPDKLVGRVDVMLARTGSRFRVCLADWEDWLAGECFEGCHHEIEREALTAVLPLLRSKFPSAKVLVAAAGMEMDDKSKIVEVGGMVARISHEFACEKLAKRAVTKGIACPGCNHFSTNYEYVRVEQVSEVDPQSHLVCQGCGKEFGPADI